MTKKRVFIFCKIEKKYGVLSIDFFLKTSKNCNELDKPMEIRRQNTYFCLLSIC